MSKRHNIEEQVKGFTIKRMLMYALLNFTVVCVLCIVFAMSLVVSAYTNIYQNIEDQLTATSVDLTEDGIEGFDESKFASAIKYFCYDADLQLMEEGFEEYNFVNIAIDVPFDVRNASKLITDSGEDSDNIIDLATRGYFFTIEYKEQPDTYYAYLFSLPDEQAGVKYMMTLMPINDLQIFESAITAMLPIFLPLAIAILFGASVVVSYYQSIPNIRAIRNTNRFTSDVSHELNTPLSIVQSNLQDMLDDPHATIEDKSTQLYASLREVDRLKKLTNQLLIMSRCDNNKLPVNKMQCDIVKLVQLVVEPYQLMAEMDNKEFNINLRCKSTVRLDKDLFVQVLVALLDNAIKYTRVGESITLSLSTDIDRLILEVSDTGKGVAEHDLPKIFDRFYRSEESRSSDGSGLGLSIVHAVVIAQGGSIEAKNIFPHGFSVVVQIPV